MKNIIVRLCSILVGVLVGVFDSVANQAIPLSIEKLTRKADLVLEGTVRSTSCQRDFEGRIYTRVLLDVVEVWKGQVPPDFVVVQPGGVLGEEVVTVSGQDDFAIGQEVALFLVLNPRREGVVIGVSQGKFKIVTDKVKGRTVSNGFHGKAREQGANLQSSATPALTVTELKQRVRGESK